MVKYLERNIYVKQIKIRVMSEDKTKESTGVFVKGNFRKKTFDNGGSVVNQSFNMEHLNKIWNWNNAERVKRGLEEVPYLNITLKAKKEEDEYGNTHYNIFEPWFPEKSAQPAATKKETATDELPF
jgi:hypothetical protein